MTKSFDYIVDESCKVIYLPPPTGAPCFIMAQARDYIFQYHFGDQYTRTILNEKSWSKKSETYTIQTLPAIAVKKTEDK
tara:strand:+ start:151 stop:387 length:237 start_codon:yes stop_codon:yes gene_type:complete